MKFPSLGPEDGDRIGEAVRSWALYHPHPETPVLMMLDGSAMTPRDISDALDRPDSRRGKTLYRMFAVMLHDDETGLTVNYVLEHFEQDILRWREQARG